MRKYLCVGAIALLSIIPPIPQQVLNVYGNQLQIMLGPEEKTLLLEYDRDHNGRGDTLFVYVPVGVDKITETIKLELLGRYDDKNNDGKYSLDELTKREFERNDKTTTF